MHKAWDKYNQVYLGIQVADTYNLFTKFPVKTVADLKGKKMYGPTHWPAGFKAPVRLP